MATTLQAHANTHAQTVRAAELMAIDEILSNVDTGDSSGSMHSGVQKIFDFFRQIPYKILFFIFIIVIILSSDIFGQQILAKVPGATKTSTTAPTIKGSIIQSAAASIILFAIVILDKLGVV